MRRYECDCPSSDGGGNSRHQPTPSSANRLTREGRSIVHHSIVQAFAKAVRKVPRRQDTVLQKGGGRLLRSKSRPEGNMLTECRKKKKPKPNMPLCVHPRREYSTNHTANTSANARQRLPRRRSGGGLQSTHRGCRRSQRRAGKARPAPSDQSRSGPPPRRGSGN